MSLFSLKKYMCLGSARIDFHLNLLLILIGKCYKASSSKSLGQALESIVQKIQCGIVVNFEKIGGPEPPPPIPAEGTERILLALN